VRLAVFLIFLLVSLSFGQDCSKYLLTKEVPILKTLEENKQYLGLEKEQEEKILSIKDEYEPKISVRQEEIDLMEEEILKLTLEKGDAQKIKELIIKLAQLKAENTALKIKQIREIQKVLTESQYQKLLKLLEESPI